MEPREFERRDALERDIDRRLKRLPAPRAPRSLAPRVMAALAASQRLPWYARGWRAWPRVWQVASVTSLVCVLAGLVWGMPQVLAMAGALSLPSLTLPSGVAEAMRPVGFAWDIGRVVYRTTVEPLLGYLVIFMFAMMAACVAFGAALDRVALGGPSEI